VNVERVHLRNFRSYEQLELVLPSGATALIGPNGAGKSSILAAVDLAIFGAVSLQPYLRHGSEKLEVAVELAHAGERYRIKRGFANGRSYLDFERWTP
jgi:exonuclease SbcC